MRGFGAVVADKRSESEAARQFRRLPAACETVANDAALLGPPGYRRQQPAPRLKLDAWVTV